MNTLHCEKPVHAHGIFMIRFVIQWCGCIVNKFGTECTSDLETGMCRGCIIRGSVYAEVDTIIVCMELDTQYVYADTLYLFC